MRVKIVFDKDPVDIELNETLSLKRNIEQFAPRLGAHDTDRYCLAVENTKKVIIESERASMRAKLPGDSLLQLLMHPEVEVQEV